MDLNGIWRVKVTSGPLWFRAMNWLRDKKIIKGNSGHNVASGIKWGRFTISEKGEEILLNYTRQPIVDKVRSVGEGRLSGKFYLKGNYIGTFDMMMANNEKKLDK